MSSTPRHIAIHNNSNTAESNADILSYVEQIRTMLTGMDERLQLGEKNIQAVVHRAETEKRQLQDILKQETGPVPA